ncbi:PucR family transcriptional regulator [Ureibacillus sp. MALMAid1270]|uniref:PucR family transcriptional regulator n=1 Tax=Ureibacillus sp. MALMAid1270 TaxID=3411629 RepID=UPI003BA42F23
MNNYSLQVHEVLKNNHFASAEVIAGNNGLNNIIKWVHVLEISNVEKLLKGNELILTTGVSIQNDTEKFLTFVEGLIKANCAGLCIEYGEYIQKVPDEVIELANYHEFPIIVFHEIVAFVEITQDLHSLIINQQYLLISKLEKYAQALSKETLYAQTPEHLLKVMYKYLKVQTIFKVKGKEPIFIPNLSKQNRQELLKVLEENSNSQNPNILSQPIHLFEHHYAEIILYSKEKGITEFESLILDRTATALGELLIRNLYVEERKGIEDAKWVEDWLDGKHSKEDIDHYIMSQWPDYIPRGCTTFVTFISENKRGQQVDKTYIKLFFKSILNQYGFHSIVAERNKYLIFILLNMRERDSMKERLEEAVKKIDQSELLMKQDAFEFKFAVGKLVAELHSISESYQSALDTIYISRKIRTSSNFYDDLHLFRLIYQLQKNTNLQEMVNEYLQPIIEFDAKYNGQLLETLEVYLQTNGSKQETAKRLFIVRQTLYHRIRKIESLIGEDFMNGEKRLAFEFMLLARKFIAKV